MRSSRPVWRRHARILGGLAAPVLLSLCPQAPAAESILTAPAAVVAPAAPQIFTLWSAQQTAVEHQPTVAAARASLAAAEMKAAAIERIRFGGLVARDLPVRKQQAALGVSIAAAEVRVAECDARNAATFTYLAALYARQQQRAADAALTRLADLRTATQTAITAGRKDVSADRVTMINSFIEVVEGRKEEAVQGYQRALAALREALGFGPDCPVAIVDGELPDLHTKADRDLIVHLALERRGEVFEAATAEQVFCLEVDAQGRILFRPQTKTLASGGDIHAKPLAAAGYDPDYRPGPIAPEMPVNLAGSRTERTHIAGAYHDRSVAVAEKTRNLIALEAEDAYLRWKQYDEEEPRFAHSAEALEGLAGDLAQKFDPGASKGGYPNIEDILNAGLRASQVRLDATQAHFRRLTALANLERVTGGGFDAGFDAVVLVNDKK